MKKQRIGILSLKNRPLEKARWRKRGLLYSALYFSLIPLVVRADVTDTLTNFLGYLTGSMGKAVAGLAIVSVGFGCFAMGKVPKGYVIAVVVGVGVIFGAKAILSMLTG